MMSGSRVSASPRPDCFSTNINMPTFIRTTISSSLFLSSTLHFSPIISISPNSSFYQSPNKNALVLHRSSSNLVCFQQSGVTSFGENKDKSVHEGVITQSLSNGMYSVDLDGGNTVLGRISGKIRKRFIQILPGDRVQVEISRYDTSKGRIIYRITEDNTDKDDIPKKPGKPQRKRK